MTAVRFTTSTSAAAAASAQVFQMALHRFLQASQFQGDNASTTTQPPHPALPRQNINEPSSSQDTYEFIAFVLWYMFLVLCCVIPTCCAYRRRRMVEARLAQQQARFAAAADWQRPFFLLDQYNNSASNNAQRGVLSERLMQLRTDRLQEELKETTMILKEDNILDLEKTQREPETNKNYDDGEDKDVAVNISVDLEQGVASTVPDDSVEKVEISPQHHGKDEEDDEHDASRIQLPTGRVNGDRSVPGICTVCLCTYEEGDSISWSTTSNCNHAFHTDCIIPWLAKKEEQKCPVCRQDFCTAVRIQDDQGNLTSADQYPYANWMFGRPPAQDRDNSADLFLDSFALALNYARTQNAIRQHQAAAIWERHQQRQEQLRAAEEEEGMATSDEIDSAEPASVEMVQVTEDTDVTVADDNTELPSAPDIEQGTTQNDNSASTPDQLNVSESNA